MSLSKNQIKLINSLRQKKYRKINGLFIAEGVKVVKELLDSNFTLKALFATEKYVVDERYAEITTRITENELKKITTLKTPNRVLGIFHIPKAIEFEDKGLIIALDAINDPGNLGTIVRLCDWFGVKHLICSEDTVDLYNQKVIQASMGSITRVNVIYKNLVEVVDATQLPVYIADMDGVNVYKTKLPQEAILIMGNEANGISEALRNKVSHKISIPRFGEIQETESLNVATATSILLSEFRRGGF